MAKDHAAEKGRTMCEDVGGSRASALLCGIAERHGLTLCDFCEQPKEIHVGFDHGKGQCLVAQDGIGIGIRYPNSRARDDAIRRVNAFYEDVANAEDAQLQIGAGI